MVWRRAGLAACVFFSLPSTLAGTGDTAGWILYRFTWKKTRGALSLGLGLAGEKQYQSDGVHLGDVVLRYAGQLVDLSVATAYTVPTGRAPIGEEIPDDVIPAAFAIDGNTQTPWLSPSGDTLVIHFSVPTLVDSYTFFTAGDAAHRDPIRWALEGSNNGGVTWEVIHELTTDFIPPDDRLMLYTPPCSLIEWFQIPPCIQTRASDRLQKCFGQQTFVARKLPPTGYEPHLER